MEQTLSEQLHPVAEEVVRIARMAPGESVDAAIAYAKSRLMRAWIDGSVAATDRLAKKVE